MYINLYLLEKLAEAKVGEGTVLHFRASPPRSTRHPCMNKTKRSLRVLRRNQ